MNRLFVAYKPPFISSNAFLTALKRKYRVKKAGFSGTLDPFASGTLIIAFGAYTKLFRYLKKYPKVYRSTLWLGAYSKTLDIEGIESIQEIPAIDPQKVQEVIQSFQGSFTYTPPLFSAKKIGGKRAYKFAHKNIDINLEPVTSHIYEIKLLAYKHPFITFKATVSEGTYIRSLGEAIAKRLGSVGTLSYLERVREGAFFYQNENALDPINFLITTPNTTSLPKEAIKHGKKLSLKDLAIKEDGLYHLLFEDFFTIIQIKNGNVIYLQNQIPRSTCADQYSG